VAHWRTVSALAAGLTLACAPAFADPEPDPDEAEIAHARQILIERLRAAEQTGVIISRRDPSAEESAPPPVEGEQPAPAEPTQQEDGAPEPPSFADGSPGRRCIDAASFASARARLGDDPLSAIDLFLRLASETAQSDRDAVRNELALSYLTIGFIDEAAGVLTPRAPDDVEASALALVAAAAGADTAASPSPRSDGLCRTLQSLTAFATSADPSRSMTIDAAAMDEIASLPAALASEVAGRLVSRLLDLRAAGDAERLLGLLDGLPASANDAGSALLHERLKALKASLHAGAADDGVPVSERLGELTALIAHPEFNETIDPLAATSALEVMSNLGAPSAMRRSKLLARTPPAVSDYYLAKALMRAGDFDGARALIDLHPDNDRFPPLREMLDMAHGGADQPGEKKTLAAAWRSGDWKAAEARLREVFANAPTVKTAKMLFIASAMNKSAPSPAASALLANDPHGRELLSWLTPPPASTSLESLRGFSNIIAREAVGLKSLVADE